MARSTSLGIDVGGGTTDLIINTHRLEGVASTSVTAVPEQIRERLQRRATTFALRVVQAMSCRHRSVLRGAGIANPDDLMAERCGDRGGGRRDPAQSAPAVPALQIAHPIASELMRCRRDLGDPASGGGGGRAAALRAFAEGAKPRGGLTFVNEAARRRGS